MPCLSDKVYLIFLVFIWADKHDRNVVIGNKKNGICPAKSLFMWDKKNCFLYIKVVSTRINKIWEKNAERKEKS